ncbi:hypothetical protein CBR_g33939 [Chara braunii]|uniref:Uncharacterized protein n=1 Tax=Chara braunii TaxID=69332 RepID=A0A388LHM4_CHABU|nr:hypothetical protein CBR_g33939 [Chara braunii]|eukprot:GBG81761.1 hypothetical protein CBR_g33939 [Chara braunii]
MAASTLSAANTAMAAASLAGATTKVEISNPATRASRVFAPAAKSSTRSLRSFAVRAQAESQEESGADHISRRFAVNALAAAVASTAIALSGPAFAERINIGAPPAAFGGLPGTGNADEARDLDKPLKQRFYLQRLPTAETLARVKQSADEIVNVKPLIEKKQWPYVQNELRSQAGALRFDLSNLLAEKPKSDRTQLKALQKQLFEKIEELDYAARSKNLDKALKLYGEAVPLLNDVVSKFSG